MKFIAVLVAAGLAVTATAALHADPAEDAIDGPREVYESRATIDLPADPDPELAERCYEHGVTVPAEWSDFRSTIERWIATCVSSRTVVNGKPIRRERQLVRGNASLTDVWNLLQDDGVTGEPVQIFADYEFEGRRVVDIFFFLYEAPDPEDAGTTNP